MNDNADNAATPQTSGINDLIDLALSASLDPDVTAGRNNSAEDVTAGRDKSKRQRPKGYHDWTPRAKAKRDIEQVKEILVEYEDYLPLTVRQIFYRMVGVNDYPKHEKAYRALQNNLNLARRAGMIPFSAIRDDGVVIKREQWHGGTEDFWDDVGTQAREYRRDRQAGQPVRIELWAEAAGMLPQLAQVANEYSVPVYSAGGYPSVTANRQVAQRALNRHVPTVLLHVGDFDPSGASIFKSMAADVAAFVEADRVIQTLHVEAVRVALTGDQVAEYDLPTSPAKKSDSRSAKWKGETCQLEALTPDALAQIVEAAIRDRMDLDWLDYQIRTEAEERTQLLHALPSGASS